MKIRRAKSKDLPQLQALLNQVILIHHQGRPDLFGTARKYTDAQLLAMLPDDATPIFVAADENDVTVGYAFCQLQDHADAHQLTPIKTLYIDDLCVEENHRGQHIGSALYRHVLHYAKEIGCYNVTLNVWALNEEAKAFYDRCGMQIQKYGMETIL